MNGAIDEVFLNVTPLHRAEPYIQSELNKLQASVRDAVSLLALFNMDDSVTF